MPTNHSKAATLTDVAHAAGVSLATASRALNGRAHVSPTARERVLAAAKALSFTPNEMAKSLTAGRSGTVGLLTGDLEGRFMIPILAGAEDAFGAGEVNVFLCDARGDSIREQHHLRALLSRRVDGIIVVGPRTDPRPSLGQDLPVPVVYAYAPSTDERDVSIVPDDAMGVRLQIEHLLACGRTRIAHISGDPTFVAAQIRRSTTLAVMEEKGLELVAPPMLAEWSESWGRDATAALLAQHPDVDGITCGSDRIARGVLETLKESGRRVPEDVAVVGYDNWTALAEESRPALTTIDANLGQLGRRAAIRMFAALDEGRMEPGTEVLPVHLVVRGSTIPRT